MNIRSIIYYQYLLFEQLQQNKDEQLAAICTKALKEIKPGYGLGNLKFGMTRAEVKLMLGEPSFIILCI